MVERLGTTNYPNPARRVVFSETRTITGASRFRVTVKSPSGKVLRRAIFEDSAIATDFFWRMDGIYRQNTLEDADILSEGIVSDVLALA